MNFKVNFFIEVHWRSCQVHNLFIYGWILKLLDINVRYREMICQAKDPCWYLKDKVTHIFIEVHYVLSFMYGFWNNLVQLCIETMCRARILGLRHIETMHCAQDQVRTRKDNISHVSFNGNLINVHWWSSLVWYKYNYAPLRRRGGYIALHMSVGPSVDKPCPINN